MATNQNQMEPDEIHQNIYKVYNKYHVKKQTPLAILPKPNPMELISKIEK